MKIDRDLLKASSGCIGPLKEVQKQRAIEKLEELTNDYTVACKLSCPQECSIKKLVCKKDPASCARWEVNARRAEKRLKAFIIGNGGTIEKCKGK